MYERKANKKLKIFGTINIIIIIYIFSLSIGYSLFNETLKISGNASTIDDVKDWFIWDSETIIGGLTDKGIEAVKANGGELVIPEGVTEISSSSFNLGTGEGAIDKGFSPIMVGKIDINDPNVDLDATIADPNLNFITSVTLPSTLKKIGTFAFMYCSKIVGDLVLPSQLSEIGTMSFYQCINLSVDLILPDSVIRIGEHAFAIDSSADNKITSISLASSTNFVANSSFYNRPTPIRRIVAGLKATGSAGEGTTYFYDNGKISFEGKTINNANMHNEILAQIQFKYNLNLTGFDTLLILQSYLGSKYGEPMWQAINVNNREDFVALVNGTTLTAEDKLSVITLSDELQSYQYSIDLEGIETIVGTALMASCGTITIPDSVTSISGGAIGGDFETLNFGKGMKVIPSDLFDSNTNKIMNINIPEGVTEIQARAFASVKGFTTITIPSTITSIGDSALYNYERKQLTIINKTGKAFDWGHIAAGAPSGQYAPFETGTVTNNEHTVIVTK